MSLILITQVFILSLSHGDIRELFELFIFSLVDTNELKSPVNDIES